MAKRQTRMAESLSDRHFESYRRVLPRRLVWNRDQLARHHEEYAQAVVDKDGGPIGKTTEELLSEVLLELRSLRMGLIAGGLAEEVDVA